VIYVISHAPLSYELPLGMQSWRLDVNPGLLHPSYAEMRCHFDVWTNWPRERWWAGFHHYRRAFLFPTVSTELVREVMRWPLASHFEVSQARFFEHLASPETDLMMYADVVCRVPEMCGVGNLNWGCRPQDWEIFAEAIRDQGYDLSIPYFLACNMFLMKWGLFDRYMQDWRRVFTEVEGSISPPDPPDYQHRVFGFLSERFFTLWLHRERCTNPSLRVLFLPVLFCPQMK